jgi:beta-phosphoglucomutase-like phosphatase (HAD superfamily)
MTHAGSSNTLEAMSASTIATRRSGSTLGRRLPVRSRAAGKPQVLAFPLEKLSAGWRGALDAADRALQAAAGQLPAAEVLELRKRMNEERASTARVLDSVARTRGNTDPFVRLMVARSQLKALLGLPNDVTGCVFDLDGLLIGGAAAHAYAWTETFDELVEGWPIRAGESLGSFDPRTDYPMYMHGRPRLGAIRAFLASRGIRLPEGDANDCPGTSTVHGLANRKQQVLLGYLDEHGVTAFAGARRYLDLAREAGIRLAVVSPSVNTKTMLNRAGLAGATDLVLDGDAFVDLCVRPKPSPDALLAACEQLGIEPCHAAAFETTTAGVRAARAAAIERVVAVQRSTRAEPEPAEGADLVVAELGDMLRPTATR